MKALALALGLVIIILLGILIFVKPAKSPTVTPPTTHQAVFSPDGSVAVTAPGLNAVISSPVTITGQAAGPWYFEASFPIKILDGDGIVLGQGPAQAHGEWMTTGTVPFVATITFKTPKYATGTILLRNDNPSGNPARDKLFRFPVRFSLSPTPSAASGVTGRVILGSTCPVERIPPDPACAPKPYQTDILCS